MVDAYAKVKERKNALNWYILKKLLRIWWHLLLVPEPLAGITNRSFAYWLWQEKEQSGLHSCFPISGTDFSVTHSDSH